MTSNNLEPIVLDSETLAEFEQEIKQELLAILNTSKLNQVLEKYGISNPDILKLQYTIDFNQLDTSDTVNNEQEMQPFFMVRKPTIEQKISFIIPCPIDGDPKGCWIG
ncbi:MAG: hypothetical protein ACRAVC_17485 [Trichormus sp.]